MNDHLEGEVLIEGEVAGNCLSMLDRCDECVAEQHVEVREKRDVMVVAPDDVLCRKSVVSRAMAQTKQGLVCTRST